MCHIDDVAGMAEAIGRIREDRALAGQLVANGRAKLAAQFAKKRVLDQYLAVFEGAF
jgi:glycosyltransferase involved in cell wall biosynthesis